jgi:large subunit ribosomal protein L9
MNIILLENIEKVGLKYEVVTVKDGYGRNYLIPQGLALTANRQNLGKLSGIKRQQNAKENLMLDTYKGWVANLAGQNIEFVVKAGDSGRLFGSITNTMLAEKLAAIGVPVERRRIIMPAEVKELGSYSAKLDLHPSMDVRVPFDVVVEGGAPKVAAPAPVAAPVVVETVVEVAAPVVEETVEAAPVVEAVVEAAPVVEEIIAAVPAVEEVIETVEEIAPIVTEEV